MISVVVPNFNSAALLKKNLPRLLELLGKSGLEYELIVADDASTDDSLKIVEAIESDIKIVRSVKNTGFAGNVDRGIRAAKGGIVYTIKTDAIPEKAEYFKLLSAHFKDPRVFAVSAALKTKENGKQELRGSGEIYFEKGFFLHRRGNDSAIMTAWADGSASAFRRDLYLKIGGFDGLYNPFYWEDTDLGYRAWKAEYKIDYEPRAVLLHDFESGVIAGHYTKKQIETISLRNQFIFVWKNGDFKHILTYFLWEPYHDLVAVKNRNWAFFEAWWQAALCLPGILVARWRQKALVKLSDDQVLRLLSSG